MPDDRPRTLGIAHAGNSGPRLREALGAGVDVIEVDLWRHGRTLTLHHERRLPLLPLLYEGWRVRIAHGLLSIDELFDLVDGRAGLLLDLKSGGRRTADALARALERHPTAPHIDVSSHRWGLLKRLRQAHPEIGVYFSIGRQRLLDAFELLLPELVKPTGVSIQHSLLDAARVERLKAQGLRIYAWTVHDPDRAKLLAEWGVDGVTCDDLSILALLRQSRLVA